MLKSLDDSGRSCWATKVKNMLYLYGFGYVWLTQDIGDVKLFINMFKQRLIDCHTQNWSDSVNNSGRCYHYRNYKSLLDVERYLSLEIPYIHRNAFGKFRCSNHKLRVETGRHSNTPRDERICLYCFENNHISVLDCEYHAFFHCKRYEDVRSNYLFRWYSGGRELHDFYILMNSYNYDTLRKLTCYVYYLMKSIIG